MPKNPKKKDKRQMVRVFIDAGEAITRACEEGDLPKVIQLFDKAPFCVSPEFLCGSISAPTQDVSVWILKNCPKPFKLKKDILDELFCGGITFELLSMILKECAEVEFENEHLHLACNTKYFDTKIANWLYDTQNLRLTPRHMTCLLMDCKYAIFSYPDEKIAAQLKWILTKDVTNLLEDGDDVKGYFGTFSPEEYVKDLILIAEHFPKTKCALEQLLQIYKIKNEGRNA